MSQDYSINRQVRALFVRLNVDLGKVEHATTNGVVTVSGVLRTCLFVPSEAAARSKRDEAAFVQRVERALTRIRGVRDVILRLDRVVKEGGRWRPR